MVCLVLAPFASPAEAQKWASRLPPEGGEGSPGRRSGLVHRVRRTVICQTNPRAGDPGTSMVLFLARFSSGRPDGRCPRHAPATARAPLFANAFGGLRSGVRVCVGRGGQNLACGTSIARTPRLMVWRTYEVYKDECLMLRVHRTICESSNVFHGRCSTHGPRTSHACRCNDPQPLPTWACHVRRSLYQLECPLPRASSCIGVFPSLPHRPILHGAPSPPLLQYHCWPSLPD